MSLAEIQEQALALDENDRARLIASLLDTLPPDIHISDEEVLERDSDLNSGRMKNSSAA